MRNVTGKQGDGKHPLTVETSDIGCVPLLRQTLACVGNTLVRSRSDTTGSTIWVTVNFEMSQDGNKRVSVCLPPEGDCSTEDEGKNSDEKVKKMGSDVRETTEKGP